MTILPVQIRLKTTLTQIQYNQYTNYRTWSAFKGLLTAQFTNDDGQVISGFTSYQVVSMHNGVFYYGNAVDGLAASPSTNVIGSTYKVYVQITNSNYELLGNDYFIVKYKTAIVNNNYYTIEDAFGQSGKIKFDGNSSGKETYVGTSFSRLTSSDLSILTTDQIVNYNKDVYTLSGRTLLVPYENSETEVGKGTDYRGSGNVYSALIVPSGVTIELTSGASIIAAAYLGYSQPKTTVSCQRGVILNDGTINVASGCSIKAYGFIKGSGLIDLASGSSAMDCIATYDWAGGSNASGIYSKVFPSNAWTMHNISCDAKINAGAIYEASMHVIMSLSFLGIKNPIASGVVFGSSSSTNCMFKPTGNSGYILKSTTKAQVWGESHANAVALNSITGSNQIAGQKDVLEIHGSYTDSQLKINLDLGITVNFSTSTDIAAPIPYMDITVANGTNLTLSNSSYFFLPGTSIDVEKGATVTVGSGVNVSFVTYAELAANTSYANASYGFLPLCVDKDYNPMLKLNGTLNIIGRVGGNIVTSSEGAVLNYASGSANSNSSTFTSMAIVDDNTKYLSFTCNAHGNIGGADGQFGILAYISTANPDATDEYYWMAATDVEQYTINFYDGTELLATKTIYAVDKDQTDDVGASYSVTGGEHAYSKRFYDFKHWKTSDGKVAGTDSIILSSALTSIDLYAQWDFHSFNIVYTTAYNGETIYDATFTNKMTSFTLETFTNNSNTLNITTTASYVVEETNTIFNGWYIGIDDSIVTAIDKITLTQFNTYLDNMSDDCADLYLYCEFTDNPKYTVTIKDSTNGIVDKVYSVQGGYSLADEESSFTYDSSRFDSNKDYEYYFNGFKDSVGNIYTYEELLELEITANSTFEVNWSKKVEVILQFYSGTDTTVSIDSDWYTPGSEYIVPNIPTTRTGHTFDYWKYGEEQKTQNSKIIIPESETVTLIASYTRNSVSVTITTGTVGISSFVLTYTDSTDSSLNQTLTTATTTTFYYGGKYSISGETLGNAIIKVFVNGNEVDSLIDIFVGDYETLSIELRAYVEITVKISGNGAKNAEYNSQTILSGSGTASFFVEYGTSVTISGGKTLLTKISISVSDSVQYSSSGTGRFDTSYSVSFTANKKCTVSLS